MEKALFGTTREGRDIYLYTIKNEKGMQAKVMNFGAILQSLLVPDKNGKLADVCLGYDKLEDYYDNPGFFGSTIGPNGNRIADARFTVDGIIYKLDQNDGVNNLHSHREQGVHKKVWEAKEDGDTSVAFFLKCADGEIGFPGNKTISVTYTLTEWNELKISYCASSDKKTMFNMTNHSYFNLSGHDSGVVTGQKLTLHADGYTPVREGLIPTGKIESVQGTPMDFTEGKLIGQDIDVDFEQLNIAGGYDHNYVLRNHTGSVREFAVLEDPVSGRVMRAFTDLPGVQVYAGNFITTHTGKENVIYNKRQAICLETQNFPNAVNEPSFPSPIYDAGQAYMTTTIYQFQ